MGDPMKCAMVQMQGVFAQLDKSTLVLKLRKARQRIRQEGRQPGAKNYSPDPVQNHVVDGRKPYGHRPGESAIVERILALRQAGAAMDTIAERLNAEGVKPRKGGQWYGPTVRNVLLRSERLQPTA